MINPNTVFGKVMLVFFWGGLSAIIVTYLWFLLDGMNIHLQPLILPYLVPIVNMTIVGIKNYLVKIQKND